MLSQRALPAFGDRPVDAITPEDVLRILTPIWSSKPHPGGRIVSDELTRKLEIQVTLT